MKGEILTGDEVLKLIGEGNREELNDIYEIYRAGNINIARLNGIYLGSVLEYCITNQVIFIRITKE